MQMMTSYFCNRNSSESYIFEKKKTKEQQQKKTASTEEHREHQDIRSGREVLEGGAGRV